MICDQCETVAHCTKHGCVPKQPAPVQEPEHIVHSNGRYSPLLTRMMNKRVESNVKQVIHLYDEPASVHEPDLIAQLKHPEDHYEFTDPKKANAVLMSLCQEAADALAAPVHEPSGFFRHEDVCGDEVGPPTPYYLTPPAAQRQWVGLTDEEKRQIFEREDYQGWLDYINAIEAKLKEKNT